MVGLTIFVFQNLICERSLRKKNRVKKLESSVTMKMIITINLGRKEIPERERKISRKSVPDSFDEKSLTIKFDSTFSS